MRRILLWTWIVIVGGSATAGAAPKEVLRPSGVPPEFALLRSSGGKLILSRVVTKAVPEDSANQATEDAPGTAKEDSARLVSENRWVEVPIDEFDVYTLSGVKYPKSSLPKLVKWLADRKKPWRALVSGDGRPVDPFYRQFAAEGTLVLVRKSDRAAKKAPSRVRGSSRKPPTGGTTGRKPTGKTSSRVPAKSVPSGKQVNIVFRNRGKQPVRLFWVDYEGREKDFGEIAPGKAVLQCSNSRCVWKFKIYGETVTSCCTSDQSDQAFDVHPPSYVLTAYEAAVLRLINNTRRRYGLRELRHDRRLSQASRDHSHYMSRTGSFSHTSGVPGKYSFTDRAAAFGTSAISENIAWDGGGPQSVVNMWMNSPGHQANILDPSATTIGIGHSGVYWTQMFGAR